MAFTAYWNAIGFNGGGIDLTGSSRVFNINWGDGSSDRIVLGPGRNEGGDFFGSAPVHWYASDGTYDVAVSQAQAGLPPTRMKAFMYARTDHDITINGTYLGDMINGGSANDTLNGAGGHDVIAGNDGNDRINGGADDDFLLGGNGDDTILGGTGTDLLSGGDGADVLRGGDDRDFLYADAGNDALFGDAGDDYLVGGAGVDRLTGGAGNDEFVFDRPRDSFGNPLSSDPDRDTIMDFTQGQDRIRVSDWAAGFAFIDTAGFSRSGAPEIRAVFNGVGDTVVFGDANGDGTADFSIRLSGQIHLTAGDFNF